jgi:hypothetical protein
MLKLWKRCIYQELHILGELELNKMSRQEIATRFGSELVTEILVIKYGSYNAISNSYKIATSEKVDPRIRLKAEVLKLICWIAVLRLLKYGLIL